MHNSHFISTQSVTGLDSATTATTLSSDAEDNTTSGDELKSSAVELLGSRLKAAATAEAGGGGAAAQTHDYFDPAADANVQRSSSFTQARLLLRRKRVTL